MNPAQLNAIKAFQEGKNLLITGPAGTGKTHVLKTIIARAASKATNIGVTASTGLAAYIIKGRTIHSFLGIGLGKKSANLLAASIKSNRPMYTKLCKLEVLVIDEISMVDAELFEKIGHVLCDVRQRPNDPFGGVQLVLCGDFCQLPPVKGDFCFQSPMWEEARIEIVHLNELMRQQGDIAFQELLGRVRWGQCDDQGV